MSFWEMLVQQDNVTFTENGDRALKSSLSGCADFMFFGGMGKTSETSDNEIIQVFKSALNENPLYAIRLLFYNRDIRGGQGARRVFRVCLKYLAENDPELAKHILCYVPEYGRWDDLLELIDVKETSDAVCFLIKETLKSDFENMKNKKSISLLAKWLPSENASSKKTTYLAKMLRTKLRMSSREYRKMLSGLRSYLNIVEHYVTTKDYENIKYENVPSKAMLKYRSAFMKNDSMRYTTFISDVNSGKTKINAGTLYPFDIVHRVMKGQKSEDLDPLWNNLPDFFGDKFNNAIVVADVSGSMMGNPLEACIGLAIYIAEHNKGEFYNKFITFSHSPTLQKVAGANIVQKVRSLSKANWDMNTNLSKVFELIYDTAVNNNVSQTELPEMIYIISDMQFDECCESASVSTFEMWKEKFNQAGYKLPAIVFWNVSDRCKTIPVVFNETGTILISGYSPSICKMIMSGDFPKDSSEFVKRVCESERYCKILAEFL